MKDFPKFQEIQQFQSRRKRQIVDSFVVPEDKGAAQIISKGDFEEAYPLDKFEVYSIQALTKFREDLMKAEGESYTDENFKAAVKGVQSFVVQDNGNQIPVFVRKKEAGE